MVEFDGGLRAITEETYCSTDAYDRFFQAVAQITTKSLNHGEAVRALDELRTWSRVHLVHGWCAWATHWAYDGPGTTRVLVAFENNSDAVNFFMTFN